MHMPHVTYYLQVRLEGHLFLEGLVVRLAHQLLPVLWYQIVLPVLQFQGGPEVLDLLYLLLGHLVLLLLHFLGGQEGQQVLFVLLHQVVQLHHLFLGLQFGHQLQEHHLNQDFLVDQLGLACLLLPVLHDFPKENKSCCHSFLTQLTLSPVAPLGPA